MRKTGASRCIQTGKRVGERADARDFSVFFGIERVKADVQPVETGAFQTLCVLGQPCPVRRHRKLADNRSENADDWKLNDTWEWVDLSELGQIASIYFTMESSDTGDYGINTPTYFCLDKLTVSTEPSSVEESVAAQAKVYYDRSNGTVRVESAQLVEAAVYNMSGTLVMKQLVEGSGAIDMSAYPAGVYVVRCGGYSTKIVK